MTRRIVARPALALLRRYLPGDDPLAGDLLEEFQRGRSAGWLWRQVLSVVLVAWRHRHDEIRPLKLVDVQPSDAIERTRRLRLRCARVNLTGSPLDGVGGLGLIALGLIVLYAAGVVRAL